MLDPTRIRIDNAVATTTSAPTAATDGVAIPKQKRNAGFHMQRIATEVVTNGGGATIALTSFVQLRSDGELDLVLKKSAGSGTRTLRVKVYFYYDEYQALTENAGAGMDTLAAVASSGTWALAFDTGALSEAADFTTVYRITPQSEPGADLNVMVTHLATIAGDTTSLDAKVPALGVAASAASSPVVLASDDAQLGAVGAAADADGNLHAQLYYLANKLDAIAADTAQVNDQSFTAAKLVDQLALTTSADKSAQLSAGRYRIASDADCYILQADTDAGTDLATYANGHFLAAGVVEYITVTGATDDFLAALVVSGTGVLTISGPF